MIKNIVELGNDLGWIINGKHYSYFEAFEKFPEECLAYYQGEINKDPEMLKFYKEKFGN